MTKEHKLSREHTPGAGIDGPWVYPDAFKVDPPEIGEVWKHAANAQEAAIDLLVRIDEGPTDPENKEDEILFLAECSLKQATIAKRWIEYYWYSQDPGSRAAFDDPFSYERLFTI